MAFELLNLEETCAVTSLKAADVRMLMGTREEKVVVEAASFLKILVYDALVNIGVEEKQAREVLNVFGPTLSELGSRYSKMEPGQKISVSVLQLLDSRYITIVGSDFVLDLTEMKRVVRMPVPLLSVGIVLPELFARAQSGLLKHRAVRSEASDPPAAAPTPTSAP